MLMSGIRKYFEGGAVTDEMLTGALQALRGMIDRTLEETS
jgi:hypothetical protein